jgi:hypothetical protein
MTKSVPLLETKCSLQYGWPSTLALCQSARWASGGTLSPDSWEWKQALGVEGGELHHRRPVVGKPEHDQVRSAILQVPKDLGLVRALPSVPARALP